MGETRRACHETSGARLQSWIQKRGDVFTSTKRQEIVLGWIKTSICTVVRYKINVITSVLH